MIIGSQYYPKSNALLGSIIMIIEGQENQQVHLNIYPSDNLCTLAHSCAQSIILLF